MISHPNQTRAAAFVWILVMVALGCTDHDLATNVSGPASANLNGPSFVSGSSGSGATQTAVNFTVGPLALSGLKQSLPGHNWHLRDVDLNGPVTGDLSGSAAVLLNANLDAIVGSGPAWGTMTIVTAGGDTWQGTLTGNFQSGAPYGIQLFSKVVLHGPDGATLRAECNETSVTSETLACTGEILNPHP